ncbi:unnamed protein product [Closterium sp. NIES-64]|nr:unnamed protein product [Closterium sp. NIES-64]
MMQTLHPSHDANLPPIPHPFSSPPIPHPFPLHPFRTPSPLHPSRTPFPLPSHPLRQQDSKVRRVYGHVYENLQPSTHPMMQTLHPSHDANLPPIPHPFSSPPIPHPFPLHPFRTPSPLHPSRTPFPLPSHPLQGLRLRMPCIVHIATASPPRPSPPRPSHPHPSPLLLHGLSAIGPASSPTLTFNRVNAGQRDFPAIHSLPSPRLVRRCHHCLPALLPHHRNGLTAIGGGGEGEETGMRGQQTGNLKGALLLTMSGANIAAALPWHVLPMSATTAACAASTARLSATPLAPNPTSLLIPTPLPIPPCAHPPCAHSPVIACGQSRLLVVRRLADPRSNSARACSHPPSPRCPAASPALAQTRAAAASGEGGREERRM